MEYNGRFLSDLFVEEFRLKISRLTWSQSYTIVWYREGAFGNLKKQNEYIDYIVGLAHSYVKYF
jgi:hypothetical protein